ncbi:MAG: SUMF1/EgtB/PvdO family nonheme iron enzyme, partial [Bacteroidetes bacterium]|nr:SUMF1/EgtB/PvdO family nonheme iron enzyme [Bacteroidota bacterium]
WHDNYEGAPTDGTAWIDQDADAGRVVRGGSCFSDARLCRVSFRNGYSSVPRDDSVGFRLALSL